HKCFTGEFFKACIDALHLTDEIETIKNYVKIINGASPPPTASPQDCFGTEYFMACIQALQLDEEMEKFFTWRDTLGKKK
uniref:Uncharacterized protein n=1 Tax=Megaselia scalaris TaxID=36166 RepID=T1GJB5_MEGSC